MLFVLILNHECYILNTEHALVRTYHDVGVLILNHEFYILNTEHALVRTYHDVGVLI